MFDEVVQGLTPRLTNQDTNYQVSLELGLKVAITLRHLASGCLQKHAIRLDPLYTISKVRNQPAERHFINARVTAKTNARYSNAKTTPLFSIFFPFGAR